MIWSTKIDLSSVLFAESILYPIVFTGDLDEVGVMQESVEDGGGGRDITDELSPFLQWPV